MPGQAERKQLITSHNILYHHLESASCGFGNLISGENAPDLYRSRQSLTLNLCIEFRSLVLQRRKVAGADCAGSKELVCNLFMDRLQLLNQGSGLGATRLKNLTNLLLLAAVKCAACIPISNGGIIIGGGGGNPPPVEMNK